MNPVMLLLLFIACYAVCPLPMPFTITWQTSGVAGWTAKTALGTVLQPRVPGAISWAGKTSITHLPCTLGYNMTNMRSVLFADRTLLVSVLHFSDGAAWRTTLNFGLEPMVASLKATSNSWETSITLPHFVPISTTIPNSSLLADIPLHLMSPRKLNTVRLPARRRFLHLITILLFIGGIEQNPGPAIHNSGKQSINCALLNIRSAVNKAALIHDQIESNQLDVLFLTETWIDSKAPAAIKNDIAPQGYQALHVHRSAGKKTRGGGIALIHRSHLKVSLLSSANFSAPQTFEVLRARITAGVQLINLVCLYRPPPSPTSAFYNELNNLFYEIESLPGHIIVCGDFNCPSGGSSGPSVPSLDERLTEVIDSFNYFQHIRKPTRRTSTTSTGNILDLLITRNNSNIISNNITLSEVGFSDHHIINFTIKAAIRQASVTCFTFRNLKNFDTDKFNEILQNSTISKSPPTTANTYMQQLEVDILNALEAVAPLQKRTKRRGSKLKVKWMTPEVVSAKRLARRRQRRKNKTGNNDDYIAYCKANRAASKAITQARSTYLKNYLAESAGNAKTLWHAAKEMLHTNKPQPVYDNNESQKLANSFTSFFSNKLSKIASNIVTHLSTIGVDVSGCTASRTAEKHQSFSPVFALEVCRLISSMKPKSSPLDFIPTSLLKSCAPILSPYIAKLANLSFSQGQFPTALKTAYVTPLLKKHNLNPMDPANYRPISNLSTIGKILERLALARLRPVILSNPNYSSYQSAYRPLHSTETAALKIMNDLLMNVDNSHATMLVSLDLSAAFDTVNHDKLLNRLADEYGFSGCILSWFESYIKDRTQVVKVGSFSGETTKCMSGVPQGSVLGPLLFSVYISPISRLITTHGIQHHKYADDTTLYVRLDPSTSLTRSHLEHCLNQVSHWFWQNDLELNPAKSEAVAFGTPTQIKKANAGQPQTICTAGENIHIADHVKIIGVTFDKHLSFNKHVTNVTQECNFHTRALRHIRPLLDYSTANMLACSIVHSRLDYCNSTLVGASNHNISRLQLVQNNLARVVCQASRHDSATELLKKLHWLPVQHRIEYKIQSLTHRVLTTKEPDYLFSLLTQYKPTRNLRSKTKSLLEVPLAKTMTGSRAFCVAGPVLWNSLPDHFRTLTHHETFKKHLKTHHFTSVFKT